MPTTPFKGVRISWLIWARNSPLALLAWVAAPASWLARSVAAINSALAVCNSLVRSLTIRSSFWRRALASWVKRHFSVSAVAN